MEGFAALLPAEVSPLFAAIMIAISFLTSFTTAAFGIGGGVILLATLAVLLPPVALIPVHGVVQLGANAGRTAIMLPHVQRPALIPFSIGSIIGATVGGSLFVQIPPWLIQSAIGLFVLWTVFGKLPAFGRRHVFVAGAFSSFLTMFFGATGNFIAAMVKTMKLPPLEHVATHSALMSIQHGLKVVAFGVLGFAFGDYLWLIVMMLVSGFAGTFVGRQVLDKLGERYFSKVLNVLLTLLAARLIWSGVEGYLAG